MALVQRAIFARFWKLLLVVFGAVQAACFVVAGFVFLYVPIWAWDLSISDYFWPWWVCSMVFAAGLLTLSRLFRLRFVKAYLNCPSRKGETVALTKSGIQITNGRSSSFVAWSDVTRIEEKKNLAVAVVGNVAIVLPDRLLAQAGDAAQIRAQIAEWHLTEHAGTE